MINPLLLPELRELLAAGDHATISKLLKELHPASIADITEGLEVDETWKVLASAPVERQAEAFRFFPPEKQQDLVAGMGRERLAQLLQAMSHDDRVDLLKRLEDEVVEDLIPLVAKADREDI